MFNKKLIPSYFHAILRRIYSFKNNFQFSAKINLKQNSLENIFLKILYRFMRIFLLTNPTQVYP